LGAVENSLRRLQTDHIDLYQSHWDDDITPVEEIMETYAELIKAGKVRAIGASNFTLTRLKASLEASARIGFPRYESVQPQYNLYDRQEFEQTLEPLCTELQVGVISYFSLARGFLSGKYRNEGDLGQSVRGGGVQVYLNERGYRILAALDEVAAQCATNPASVALAWLIARPSVTAPISSATSTAQLDDLVKAASLSLDATALEKLNKASEY
jgi:aryl-alcohol dehydrogenase-like predicted oxidoreductase